MFNQSFLLMLDAKWCACIKYVYRRLLADVQRADLYLRAVNIRVWRLKSMVFGGGHGWG